MSRHFFRVEDDLCREGRWYLNGIWDSKEIELDARQFRYGSQIALGPPIIAKAWKDGTPILAEPPLTVMLDSERAGAPLDLTFTNDDVPIVTSTIGAIVGSFANSDVQPVPVLVQAQQQTFEIMNVTRVIDCIDYERSNIRRYADGNSIRPDKAGKPQMIMNLVVDPVRIGDHHIFRLAGWEVAIIVSGTLKIALEAAQASGIIFRQVSP